MKQPLVSIITPITKDRAAFEPQLDRMVAQQDYPHIEHIYVREEQLTIGAKRNKGCALAKGEIILHFDSDDIYTPDYVSRQVAALQQSNADVVGLSSFYFYKPKQRQAWQFIWSDAKQWMDGATLCYYREAWQRVAFKDVNVGEDALFVWNKKIKAMATNVSDCFVSVLHEGNSAPKKVTKMWHPCEVQKIDKILAKV